MYLIRANVFSYSPLFVPHKTLFPGPPPGRRSLQRTLSDESIYSGQRDHSTAAAAAAAPRDGASGDLLFTCSTVPRSPTARNTASRRASHKSLGEEAGLSTRTRRNSGIITPQESRGSLSIGLEFLKNAARRWKCSLYKSLRYIFDVSPCEMTSPRGVL